MYPNPQAALPLPSRLNVEQYKKLAKDLVKACKTGSAAAIEEWATRWIQALTAVQEDSRPFEVTPILQATRRRSQDLRVRK
jgi:hypothetical protein